MIINLTTSPPVLTEVTHEWAEERLAGVCGRRRIDEAVIRVSRHAEASPAWEVYIHLVTPGPDLAATTRDHTLAAAFAKNIGELEDILDAREAKRAGRHRDHGPSSAPSAHIG
ncbi:MAG: hypothetical protein JWL81_680 [Verrucomicrobiales bacterium]|nr:hypothetical protein [Verrucomicrobiales bacterium]